MFFNNTIDVAPVLTPYHGICYKLEFSNPFPSPPHDLTLHIYDSNYNIDRLKKMNLLVASENTWQGIYISSWPYDKGPFILFFD